MKGWRWLSSFKHSLLLQRTSTHLCNLTATCEHKLVQAHKGRYSQLWQNGTGWLSWWRIQRSNCLSHRRQQTMQKHDMWEGTKWGAKSHDGRSSQEEEQLAYGTGGVLLNRLRKQLGEAEDLEYVGQDTKAKGVTEKSPKSIRSL